MQDNYDDMSPNYSDVLMKPIAVWENTLDSQLYGFPLSYRWEGVTYPLLKNHGWNFLGVLPPGTPISNITKDKGDRVRCDVGGGNRIVTELMVVHR